MTVKTVTRLCPASLGLFVALFAFTHAAFAIDPIKVGVTIAPPPGASSSAQQARDGLEIALKMINDAGGALGRPLELVYADDPDSPEQTSAAIEKLVKQDKVAAIVGGHRVAAALAAVEVAHRYKVPYIADLRSHAIGGKLYPEAYNIGISNTRIALAITEAMKALGAKRVAAFSENNDPGIELANLLGHQLNNGELGIEYSFEALDPAAKDFTPVLQPRKSNPPDAIVQMLGPPAAYALLDQLHRQGLAPTPKTWLYDASSVIENPGFWQNVNEAARGMLVFGLYHPKMKLTDLGRKVADAYLAKSRQEPNGALFQAADSLFLVAEAVKSGGSSEPEAITKALESIQWTGTRGKITFSSERDDYKYHQWLDVPYVTFQITAVNQPIGDTNLIQAPETPLDVSRVEKQK